MSMSSDVYIWAETKCMFTAAQPVITTRIGYKVDLFLPSLLCERIDVGNPDKLIIEPRLQKHYIYYSL